MENIYEEIITIKDKPLFKAVETPDAKVVANGGWLRISGAKAGARVAVYTIGGKMLSAATMNAPEASIDLSTVVDGVYIVTVGNKSYKVTKRN